MAQKNNCRALAASALAEVLHDRRSLTDALTKYQNKCKEDQVSLFKALCFGVMRHLLHLQHLQNQLLKKPLAAKESKVNALMLVGLYQLLETRVANHAAVNETLKACEALNKTWAKGLLNGVLRNFLRQKQQLLANNKTSQEAALLHPQWLMDHLMAAYPNNHQQLLANNNTQAPLTLRVNTNKISRDDYLELLQQNALTALPTHHSPVGITLSHAVPTATLPGFNEGLVSVQDQAGQMVVEQLDLKGPEKVLDACAAPGSKLCHLLERFPAVQLTAVDVSPSRLERIQQNLDRLQLPAPKQLVAADALDTSSWWDNTPFDAILLDAPCSATGVIRRHPDIKFLRQAEDIGALAAMQLKLLQSLWQTLKPGGTLIYSTCSVLPQENDQVLEKFFKHSPGATVLASTAEYGQKTQFGCQILPGDDDMDGFYYAKLRKEDLG